VAVMAYRRWTRRWCGRDVVVASFYICVSHRSNACLRTEGEREVTARRGGRATGVHACAARRSNDIAVEAALRGGDAEGVCPYAVGSGALDRATRRA
jgi:hypothetical protein